MNCTKCGSELATGEKYCGSCGFTAASWGKTLCDGCSGAFKPEDLAEVEGRRLCQLCARRVETRRLGIPEAGNARRLAYQELHEKHYPPPISSLAIASLAVAFLLPILGIPAIALGAVALVRIRRSQGTLGGEGIAVAGIGIGALTFVGTLFCVAAAIPGAAVSLEHASRGAADARVVSMIKDIESAQQLHWCDFGSYGTEQNLLDRELVHPQTFSDARHRIDLFLIGEGFMITASPRDGKGTFFLRDQKGNLRAEYGRPATESSSLWNGTPPRQVRQVPSRSG